MKKVYVEVELDIISLAKEDVITTSLYDPNSILDDDNKEKWSW